jgi:hypothetical protein
MATRISKGDGFEFVNYNNHIYTVICDCGCRKQYALHPEHLRCLSIKKDKDYEYDDNVDMLFTCDCGEKYYLIEYPDWVVVIEDEW